jgi:HSP20 family protein
MYGDPRRHVMTTLVRFREPLRNFPMNAEFERLINTVFESPARSAQPWTPPLDVWETEDDLVYAFDVPGVPEDKIAVEIEDNTLTVSGSRERAENVEDERFFRYERRFGDFTRSVALPQGCGESEAQAYYANGALEVHVKKPEQSKPRHVPVRTTLEAALPSGLN